MQLISILLLLFSVLLLVGATAFVVLWHRAYRKANIVKVLNESIGHIGVSAVVEYPETPQPLIALLEERYPRSEAVIVTDLEGCLSPFGELIYRFHLVKVNHSHLVGVRALYRSRHRAFRRVVMVDLPIESRHRALEVAKEVATYDYILQLQGESIVAHDALAYCANIIALHRTTTNISLRTLVGAETLLERCDTSDQEDKIHLLSDRVLAWRKGGAVFGFFAISIMAILILSAHLSGSRVMLLAVLVILLSLLACLYVSCRVMVEKSLFVTVGTILYNFYRFLVERIKNFHYLYKSRGDRNQTLMKRVAVADQRRVTNRKSL